MYSYGWVWVCSVCNMVYSPFMTTCPNCTGLKPASARGYAKVGVVKHECTGSSGAAVQEGTIERIDFK